MLKIKIPPILRCAFNYLFHEGRVLRMNSLESTFQGRFRRSLVLEDSKGFLRPDHFAVRNTPAEAPRATEALDLRQVGSAASQGFHVLARISDQTDTAE